MIVSRSNVQTRPHLQLRQPPPRAAAVTEQLGPQQGERTVYPRPRLVLVTKGVLRLRTADRDALLPAGRAAWIPRDMEHRLRCSETVELQWVTFWPAALAQAQVAAFDANPLLRAMMDEAASWGPTPEDSPVTDAFFDALAGLLRGWLHDDVEVDLPTASSPDLRRGLDWILDRLAHPVGPADAANHAGLSLRTFQRRCREELSLTPTDWLQRARVVRALELLTNSYLTVGEIAIRCGYQSQASFGRVFKEHIGTTPLGWRASRGALTSRG
jgi:AraC-like DNA-binding protein